VGRYDASLASFSEFYITTMGLPLPVELVDFDAVRTGPEQVEVTWSTASEEDNLGFEVWRRIADEEYFIRVGWVDGAMNSQQLLHYGLMDPNPTPLTSYYFLRQVDLDGAYTDGPVVAVNGDPGGLDIVMYPNPATEGVHLSGDLTGVQAITLLDLSGKPVRDLGISTELSLAGIPAGTYILRLTGHADTMMHLRLVVL
jgi:hypothetical protein